MSRDARLSIGFAVLLVLVLGLVTYRWYSTPVLIGPPHGGTEWEPHVHQGDTVTIGQIVTCVDGSGSVTVKKVVPVQPHGIEVTGWAIRDNPGWPGHESPTTGMGQLGVGHKPLAAYKFPTSHVVDVQCDLSKGEAVEIGVEMKKTTDADLAGAVAFDVVYSDGRTRTLTFPLSVVLCTDLCPAV